MADPQPTAWESSVLERVAPGTAYPATPALGGAVLARIRVAGPVTPRRRATAFAPFVLAAVVLVAAFVVALGVSGEAREAVAEFLGLSVPGERIEILPAPQPAAPGQPVPTPTPFPTPVDIEAYATPVPAVQAARELPFAPVLPPGLGEPRAYYLVRLVEVPMLVLEYPEFDLWEVDSVIFEKLLLGKGTTVLEQPTVKGAPAYWIAGGSHILRVLTADGREQVLLQRTVDGNTLIWRSANLNYRLETKSLTKEQAITIAESLP